MVVTQEQWQTSVKTTLAFAQTCLAYEDFSYFDSRRSLQGKAPKLYRQEFASLVANGVGVLSGQATSQPKLDEKSNKELLDTTSQLTTDIEGKIKTFANEITDEANNKPTDTSQLPAWKKKLLDKNEEHKRQIAELLDKSTNKAMTEIAKLPEEQREQAADKYTSAWDYVMIGVEKVIEFLNKAWEVILDTWNKVVEAVKAAVEKVKEWANDAVKAIGIATNMVKTVFSDIF